MWGPVGSLWRVPGCRLSLLGGVFCFLCLLGCRWKVSCLSVFCAWCVFFTAGLVCWLFFNFPGLVVLLLHFCHFLCSLLSRSWRWCAEACGFAVVVVVGCAWLRSFMSLRVCLAILTSLGRSRTCLRTSTIGPILQVIYLWVEQIFVCVAFPANVKPNYLYLHFLIRYFTTFLELLIVHMSDYLVYLVELAGMANLT
jgi:hypothetical protein